MDTQTIVAGLGSFVTFAAGLGAFLKVFIMGRIEDLKSDVKELKTDVRSVVGKLEECNEQHAAALQRAARAESALMIVGRELSPSVRDKVTQALESDPPDARASR